MTLSAYKFGGFLFYPVDNARQAENIGQIAGNLIQKIDNLSLFLEKISSRYLFALAAPEEIKFNGSAIRRLIQIAADTRAGMVYCDYFIKLREKLIYRPLIEYQPGSIRDDFHFGHVLLYSAPAVRSALQKLGPLPLDEQGALYDLRLKISIDHPIVHLPEALYTIGRRRAKPIPKNQGIPEKQFAYVAAKNRNQQKILEKAATDYLKLIGAYLKVRTKELPTDKVSYPVTASVIIPVLNRKKTIAEAIKSALNQETDFDYNIIVIDNHSTDGTGAIVEKLATRHPEIEHLIPSSFDLNIGGCWNEAIYSPYCGRYSVQLDSDDLYSSPYILQKIVDTLRKGKYAMVVGSYTIVNERLEKIPPGLIDHREWTKANGHNNALRISGLGAPRSFSTSVLRKIGFPNVGYGEDYAVALRITREYKIGRIYDSLYLCRRWSDNTDAALSVKKQNRNDFYKDKLRTLEIRTRQLLNKKET
jgi:GT2 family glycosyltransferase/uncharacterized protein YjhX (UPF0386 family)